MAYTTKRVRSAVQKPINEAKEFFIDTGATSKIKSGFSEGRYEVYSKRVQSRLTHIERTLDYAMKVLRESGLSNSPQFVQFKDEIGSLNELVATLQNGGNPEISAKIVEALKRTGAGYASILKRNGTGAGNKMAIDFVEYAQKTTTDGFLHANTEAIDALLRHGVKYNRSVHNSTKIFKISSHPKTQAAKIGEDLKSIHLEALQREVEDLLIAKEHLKMGRLARLRLSLSIGNQLGEAAEIAENYWKRYAEEKNIPIPNQSQGNQPSGGQSKPAALPKMSDSQLEYARRVNDIFHPKTTTVKGEDAQQTTTVATKSAEEIFAGDISKMEKLLADTQEHLKFHRKLDGETRKKINAENIRLFSLYNIINNGEFNIQHKEKEGLGAVDERMQAINEKVKDIAHTAGMKIGTGELKGSEIDLLKGVFNNSKNGEEFMLMLANAIDQKDVYKYFEMIDREHILIGEFLMKLVELKRAQELNKGGSGPQGSPGGSGGGAKVINLADRRRRDEAAKTHTPWPGGSGGAEPASSEIIEPNLINPTTD